MVSSPIYEHRLFTGALLLAATPTSATVFDDFNNNLLDTVKPGAAIWDNFQYIGTLAPATTTILSDDFNDNSLDSSKWIKNQLITGTTDASVAVNEVNQRIQVGPLFQNTSGFHFNGIVSKNAYDFTGAYSYIQVTSPPSSSTTSELRLSVAGANSPAGNLYRFIIIGPTLKIQRVIGGTAINLVSPFAYDLANMKFLRIRHDSATDNVVFETAPQSASDASLPGAWTLAYQEAWTNWNGSSGIQLTSVRFEVRAGTSVAESNAPGTVAFDNFQFGSNTAATTPFGGTAINLPGRIEAENFDNGGEGVAYHDTTPTTNEGGAYRSEGVDICGCSAPNGLAVGWTNAGEWMKYTVTVATSGSYKFQALTSTTGNGSAMHIEVNGFNLTGTMNLPNTGSWSAYATTSSSPVTLTAGQHVVTVFVEAAGFLFDSVDVISLNTTETVLLADNFNDNSLDSSKWIKNQLITGTTDASVPVDEVNQRIQVGPLFHNTSGFHFNGIVSKNSYNFTGAYNYIQVVSPPSSSTTGELRLSVAGANSPTNNLYRFIIIGPTLKIQRVMGGTAINLLAPFAYDLTSMKFLRIRHDSATGNVVFETAPQSASDANLPGAWTIRYQEAWTNWNGTSGIQLTSVRFEVRAGTSVAETNVPGTISFDNFKAANNSAPPANPTPTPTPTPTPGGESPNNTRVPPGIQIVDSTGAVWTRSTDGGIWRNGAGTGGNGSQILYCNQLVYVFGTDSQWYRWSNGWTPVGPTDPCGGSPTPTPTPNSESPNNTRVPPATQIVDSSGAVWTRSTDGGIWRNGAGTGGNGSQILYCNQLVYVFGTDSQWYRWSNGWTPVGPTDPCGGSPGDSGGGTTPVEHLNPFNRTGGGGEDPLSRNFNWTLPLINLPGRAGMDLGLSLSYNSLVWLRNNSNTISYDVDGGFPGPGFRLGFPVIKPLYFNSEVGKNAFLLISPDGSRTELRQVGTSPLYEAADSSYLMFDSQTMILRAPDGTQLSYSPMVGEYNCTQIKERNGNYITVRYTPSGRIDTIIDTLGRNIKFKYDANGWLTEITQRWNQGTGTSEFTHYWARFQYANLTIGTNFPGLTVQGPSNGSEITTLSRVTLADGSRYDFSYTTWGQVWKVSCFAPDGHLLNYRSYNLPQTANISHTDCPRFTERRDWAQYWNGDIDGTVASNEEAVTKFAAPVSLGWTMPDGTSHSGWRAQVTRPDQTSDHVYFIDPSTSTCPKGAICTTVVRSPDWRRGLPALLKTFDISGVLQRQVMTTWTQDNTAVLYPLNPRVIETNVYDPSGNRRRTTIGYQTFTLPSGASCSLPNNVTEYAADATTVLRRTQNSFETSPAYLDRRIIGLPRLQTVSDGAGNLVAKRDFHYDWSDDYLVNQGAALQHDGTNYGAGFFAGRGNLVVIREFDVTAPNNESLTHDTRIGYNTHGSVVFKADAEWHTTRIQYTDSFSDDVWRGTFAYPTTITDPDGNSSSSKYNFDFGGVTRTLTPNPDPATYAFPPLQFFTYDALGRLQRVSNSVNSAYTRFDYTSSPTRVDTYTTIQEGQGEAHSFGIADGLGRVVATATDHPGTEGQRYSGEKLVYDVMGRVIKTSNPTETTASGTPSQWVASGDDQATGWLYTTQTYDWKGRPLVTTNPDGTTKIASYSGCGCAGSEIVALTDEGTIDAGIGKRRQQKIFKDVLGRPVKTQIMNWEGGSVYSTTVNTYNARDQITLVRQYQGSETSGTFQDTIMTYDGYGRLQTKHVPEEQAGTQTTWTYNRDDSINTVTDPRGAITTFGYAGTNRGLVRTVTHTLSGSPQINVSYDYDAAGNRILMTDSLGKVSYSYNQLSRMTSETRTVGGSQSYTLNYSYNLAGQLSSYKTSAQTIDYTRDRVGRLTGVYRAGSEPYISNIKYRAWGARREVAYGDNRTATIQYSSKLMPTNYSIPNVMTRDYSYFADGRLKSSSFTEDPSSHRSYEYDHTGRLKSDSTLSNFSQALTYDVWGNVTNSTGSHWSRAIQFTGTYSNNRNADWDYNAAGQVTDNDDNKFTYDAAGRTSSVWMQGFASPTQYTYDGDGQVVGNSGGFSKLRSTVLSGSVVAELSNTGQISRTFVYAEGEGVVAFRYEGQNRVIWEHRDIARQSLRQAEDSGLVVDLWEETASGAKIEPEDPYPSDPNFTGADNDGEYPHLGAVGEPITGCNWYGIPVPDCNWILAMRDPFEDVERGAGGDPFKRMLHPLDERLALAVPDWQGLNDSMRIAWWQTAQEQQHGAAFLAQSRSEQRPSEKQKASTPANPQQTGFDNCARNAIREYRRAEYPVIGKIALGTVVGYASTVTGINAGTRLAMIMTRARVVTWKAKGQVLKLAAGGSLVVDWFTGEVVVQGIKDSGNHEALKDEKIEKCKKDWPDADHSAWRIAKIHATTW